MVRIGAIGTSGVIWPENLIRPMRSCGAASRKKPFRPSAACASLFSSPIEPELSKTIITLAGLRSARQACLILTSTFGSGQAQDALRLRGVDAVGARHEPGRGDILVGGAEAVAAGQLGRDLLGQEVREDPAQRAAARRSPSRHCSVISGLSEKNVPSDG